MTNPVGFRSTTLVYAGLVTLLLTILAACGPSGDTQPPTNGDTSVNVTVTGPGQVVQGDFSCSGSCTWTTDGSQPITLQAVPDTGNVLVAWGGVCPVLDESCTRTFEDGDDVTVTFAPHAVRLDLTGDGEGLFRVAGGPVNATCAGDCGVAVDTPLQLAITYEPAGTSGTTLGDWTGACASASLAEYCLVTASGATNVGKTWLHPPVAAPDDYTIRIDTTLTVPNDDDAGVLANDRDTDGDPLTATLVNDVSNGTLTLQPDGGFEYQPDAGFTGEDGFRYRVQDAFGNTDEANVTIYVTNAMLTLAKAGTFDDANGNGLADPGETIDYTFTVTNTGTVTLTGITLDDPLIDISGGPIASLAVDEADSTTFSGSYTITQADIDAGAVENVATADSNESPPDTGSITVDLPREASLTLTKAGTFNDENSDGVADVDETIDYTFTVENTGTVTLTGISVADPLVGDTGGTLATLAPGATDATTFSGSYAVTQADIDAGEVVNTATADSNESPPDTATVTVPLAQDASLTLTKAGTFVDEDGDGVADVGEPIDYAFTVTNTGTVTLTGISVTDPLFPVAGGPIALAPGASDSTTFSGSYAVTQADIDAGEVVNAATADSNESPPDTATVTVPLAQDASLALGKSGSFAPGSNSLADPGELITYTFTLANEGNVSLTNVAVTDPLVGLSAITLVSGDADGDDQLDPTETWTYTATYPVDQDDIDAGEVVNTAQATSSETTTPISSNEETVVLPRDISLALTKDGTFVDEDDDGFADVGETIDYTFTVENTGTVTLTNVAVTDPLVGLSAITLVSGDADGDDQLDPTETWTYTATYPIDQGDIDTGTVENTATADSDESPPDTGTETVALPPEEPLP